MTIRRKIEIEIEVSTGSLSNISEASLERHVDYIMGSIKERANNVKYDEWLNTINISWDESERVDIAVNIKN